MGKIIFALILIIVVGFGGYFGIIVLEKDFVSSRAETMSEKYIANLFSEYHIIGKNCQGEDTDGDTYVSCDVRIQKGEDESTQKIVNLSCPTLWKSYTGSTCKERIALPTGN